MVTSKYVLSGYRVPCQTYGSLMCSLFKPHNDLLNIWTHLLGSLVTLYLSLAIVFTEEDQAFVVPDNIRRTPERVKYPNDRLERMFIVVFLIGSFVAMFSSAVYHTFRPKSKRVYLLLRSLDVAGICFINLGGVVSGNHYYNYCDPISYKIYFVLSVVFSSLACGVILLKLNFNVKFFLSQSITLLAMVAVNFVSLIQIFLMGFFSSENNHLMPFNHGLTFLLLSAVFYVIAFGFYYDAFPEKYYPKKFDIWCNSHTIWHVFVFFKLYCLLLLSERNVLGQAPQAVSFLK